MEILISKHFVTCWGMVNTSKPMYHVDQWSIVVGLTITKSMPIIMCIFKIFIYIQKRLKFIYLLCELEHNDIHCDQTMRRRLLVLRFKGILVRPEMHNNAKHFYTA